MIDTSGANPGTSQIGGTVDPAAVAKLCQPGDNVEITTVSSGASAHPPFYVAIN